MIKRLLIFLSLLLPMLAWGASTPVSANYIRETGRFVTPTNPSMGSLSVSNFTDKSNVKFWGAVGDGITDDSAAFISGFRQKLLYVPVGRYVITNLFVTNSVIVSGSAGAVIVLKSGVTNIMLDCSVGTVTFNNIEFDGGGVTVPSAFGTRHGIFMSTTNGGLVANCSVYGFTGAGVSFDGPNTTENLGGHPCCMGGNLFNNGAGFKTGLKWLGGGEYTKLLSASVYSNFIGAWIDAGNVTVDNSHFHGNSTAVFMDNHGNGGHGIITGSSFNHNTIAFSLTNLIPGELIIGNTILFSEIKLHGCKSVRFSGNTHYANVYTLVSNSNCRFENCSDLGFELAGLNQTNDSTTFNNYQFTNGLFAGPHSFEQSSRPATVFSVGNSFSGISTQDALDTNAGNWNIVTTNAPGIDVGGMLGLGGRANGYSLIFGAIRGAKEDVPDDNFRSYLGFYTGGVGGFFEKARISSGGYFGIGTNSPQANLHVRPATSGTNYFRIDHIDGTPRAQVGVFPGSETYGGIWLGNVVPGLGNFNIGSEGVNVMLNANSGSVFFQVGSDNKWSITSAGHLLAFTDGSHRIGSPGANRPMSIDVADYGSFAGKVNATNGFASYRSNSLAPFTITVGASPSSWTNTLGVNVNVFVDGVSVTGTVGLNGGTIFNTIGQCTVPTQPNEYVTITYTIGTPTAKGKTF